MLDSKRLNDFFQNEDVKEVENRLIESEIYNETYNKIISKASNRKLIIQDTMREKVFEKALLLSLFDVKQNAKKVMNNEDTMKEIMKQVEDELL